MPSKSNIDQYKNEPFEGFYEISFKFLQSYQLVKTFTTDMQLFGSESKDYLTNSFQYYPNNHKIFDKKDKINWKEFENTLLGINEFFYMTKDKKTELLSFIYHLRNAIAHGTIYYDGTRFDIIDYHYNKKTGQLSKIKSAHCRVLAQDFEKFFKQLIYALP